MKTISSLSVSLNANVKPLQDGLNKGSKSVKEFTQNTESSSGSLLKFGAVASGVAAAIAIAVKAAEALGDAFKGAAEVETASVQLRALTGSSEVAGRALDGLRKMAINTPFSFPELLTAEKRLLAVGVSADGANTILKESGDVAVGVGANIGDVADTFARVAAEGKLGSRELKEFGREGIPVVQTLAKQFHTTAQGVDQLAESGQIGFMQLQNAFAAMTGKGGKFNGMLDEQAKTIGGGWHTLTATVSEDATNLAERFLKAFNIAGLLGGVNDLLGYMGGVGTKLYLIFGFLGEKIYKAFGPVVQFAIGKVEAAISKLGKGINYVLDAILKLEGVEIPKPEIAKPDPVPITTFLDPDAQTITVQPEIKRAKALISGSAESQAARYGEPLKAFGAAGLSAAQGVGLGTSVTAPLSSSVPQLGPAINKVVKPSASQPLKHAPAFDPNSGYSKANQGINSLEGGALDAKLGPDGLYHGKGGQTLTPEEYANLKQSALDRQRPIDYGKAHKQHLADHANDKGWSSVDELRWEQQHIRSKMPPVLNSVQQNANDQQLNKFLKSDWKPGDDFSPYNLPFDPRRNSGGGQGPLSAPANVQPKTGNSSGSAAAKQSADQLLTANQWLYRIELNTRGSGGSTGATIVSI